MLTTNIKDEAAAASLLGKSSYTWPLSSPYYNALTQNAEQCSHFLESATADTPLEFRHSQPIVPVTYLKDGVTVMTDARPTHTGDGLFSPRVLSSSLTIIHFPMLRCDRADRGKFQTDAEICVRDTSVWLAILQGFDVLPNLLELLHSWEGGTMAFTSFTSIGTPTHSGNITPASQAANSRPVAFHTAYDPGGSLHEASAVYTRHDLTTGRSLVLVLGMDEIHTQPQKHKGANDRYRRIMRLQRARPDAHGFHIVRDLFALQCNQIQLARNVLCGDTEKLESKTGIGVSLRGGWTVELDKLRFSYKLYNSAAQARSQVLAATRIVMQCQALKEHLAVYQSLCERPDTRSRSNENTMFENLAQLVNLTQNTAEAQATALKNIQSRLHAQIDIQRTLMADRDTQTNIDISQAAVRDSKLVRGIAFVTMVFLPATFVATFFSMTFFNVEEDRLFHLKVDATIWIYPVITLPLTIVVIVTYTLWSSGWSWKIAFSVHEKLDTSKDDDVDGPPQPPQSWALDRWSIDAIEGTWYPPSSGPGASDWVNDGLRRAVNGQGLA